MNKTDYKKELGQLYSGKPGEYMVVQVPKLNFIMIDGHGDPNTSQEYIDAIGALYPVAYAIKFMSKLVKGEDFGVMPLEGLWWATNMADFGAQNKANWQWTAMIVQPPAVTRDLYDRAVEQVRQKKHPKAVDELRFEAYDEGRAAQVMYLGPYSDEGPVIQKLHEFITQQGGSLGPGTKHHHEIYLGDPRRTDPAKLKTIIRQPF